MIPTIVAKCTKGNVLASGQDRPGIEAHCEKSGFVYKSETSDLFGNTTITYEAKK